MCRPTGNTEVAPSLKESASGRGRTRSVLSAMFGPCAVLAALALAVVEPDPIAHRVAVDTVAECFDDPAPSLCGMTKGSTFWARPSPLRIIDGLTPEA